MQSPSCQAKAASAHLQFHMGAGLDLVQQLSHAGGHLAAARAVVAAHAPVPAAAPRQRQVPATPGRRQPAPGDQG